MSTSASPLHRQGGNDHAGQAAFAWKEELNARLRDHRQRREEIHGPGAAAPAETQHAPEQDSTAARVAARVAARYRDVPSYSELLAASAEAAAVAAETAAAAAHEAHLAAQAALQGWEQQQALAERNATAATHEDVFADPFFTQNHRPTAEAPRGHWEDTQASAESPRTAEPQFTSASAYPRNATGQPAGPITVAHHAPLPERTLVPERQPMVSRARALVDAFAEAMVPAAQQLPAKLIEFPRELIASHRQRPRLAEGPLLEPELPAVSLRIFEVEQESQPAHLTGSMNYADFSPGLSHAVTEPSDAMLNFDGEMGKRTVDDSFEDAPRRRGAFLSEQGDASFSGPGSSAGNPPASKPQLTPMERASSPDDVAPLWKSKAARVAPSGAPQESGWSSIRLGEHPRAGAEALDAAQQAPAQAVEAVPTPALESPASFSDRLMAALVDASVVFGSFLVGVTVFASCTVHPPAGKAALALAAVVLLAMGAFYGWLFMSFGGGSTPGMRYARIALCTFDDANPTRKELQNRIPATALALLPLGLGLLWALLDEDRLGWHDRMTRTYQRSYR